MSNYRLPFAQCGDSKVWERRYPGYVITFDASEVPCPHPYLAAERHIAYTIGLRLCRGKVPNQTILDIGSNVRRAMQHPDVHINAPFLMAEDFFQRDDPMAVRRICRCDGRACDHGPKSPVIFCHSSYYFTPQELFDAITNRARFGVIICHLFPYPYGSVGVDGSYQLLTPDSVAMNVAGGRTYEHSRQPHFSDANSGQLPVVGGTLLWDLHRMVGDTAIFQIRATDAALPIRASPTLPMWNSPTSMSCDHRGPTQLDDTFHVPTISNVPIVRVWSFGAHFLFTSRTDVSVVVPKELLSELTILATGRPRTLNSFDALMARAKSASSKMPQSVVERSLAYCVALAMTRGARNDALAYNHISACRDELARLAFSRANAFDHVETWAEWLIIRAQRYAPHLAAVAAAAATAATCWWLAPAFFHAPGALPSLFTSTDAAVEGFHTVVIAPVVEELFKSAVDSVLPVRCASPFFGAAEWANRALPYLRRRRAVPTSFLWPCIMHCALTPFSLPTRIVLHTAWNAMSLCARNFRPVAPARISYSLLLLAAAAGVSAYCAYRAVARLQSHAAYRSADPWAWPALSDAPAAPGVPVVQTRDTIARIRSTTAKVLLGFCANHGQSGVDYSELVGAQLMPAPTVLASNRCNELVAVTARAFPDIFPAANLATLNAYEAFVMEHFESFFGPRQRIIPLSFAAFVSHYPAPQRHALERAKANMDLFPLSTRALCRIKAFVKMEHLLKAKVDSLEMFERVVQRFGDELIADICGGCVDATPRLISGAIPEFNIVVGPWVTAFQLFLTRLWNHNSPIYMGASTTQDRLGEYFAAAVAAKAHFCEIDFTKFDASMKAPLQRIILRIFLHMGCPKSVAALLHAKITRKHGHTPHGVYFESQGGETNSGDPHTFLANTMHNALFGAFVHYRRTGEVLNVWKHRNLSLSITHQEVEDDFSGLRATVRSANWVEAPGPVHLPQTSYRAMVAGDDSVIMLMSPPAGHDDDRRTYVGDFASTAKAVGQLITSTYHGPDAGSVSFCSGLFWPTGPATFIFGPKPTNILTKHPFQKVSFRAGRDPTLSGQSGLAALRGTALGLWPSCRRIPLLREYLLSVLSKTRRTNAVSVAANPLYAAACPISAIQDDYPGHCPEALAFIQVRYGIDAATLLEFARYLRTLEYPCEADFPPLRNVYAVDQA